MSQSLEQRRREHYAALRSQLKATARAIRTSQQMLAEAESLDEQVRIAKEAERDDQDRSEDRSAVRVG